MGHHSAFRCSASSKWSLHVVMVTRTFLPWIGYKSKLNWWRRELKRTNREGELDFTGLLHQDPLGVSHWGSSRVVLAPRQRGTSNICYFSQYTFLLENKERGRHCCLRKHIYLIPFPGALVSFLTAVLKYLAKIASGGKVLLRLIVSEGKVQYHWDTLA